MLRAISRASLPSYASFALICLFGAEAFGSHSITEMLGFIARQNQIWSTLTGSGPRCGNHAGGLSSPHGATIDPSMKWDRLAIRVCWGRPENLDKICTVGPTSLRGANLKALSPKDERHFRTQVQEVVTQEFTAQATGIHFVGWENCSADAPYDAAIFLRNRPQDEAEWTVTGESSIGKCAHLESVEASPGLTPYVGLHIQSLGASNARLSLEDHVRMVALHEFGHLAGLHHEANWVENTSDTPARYRIERTSELDATSIMNYDFLELLMKQGLNFSQKKSSPLIRADAMNVRLTPSLPEGSENVAIRPGLSAGDVHALKCLYLYDAEIKLKTCNKGFKPWEVPSVPFAAPPSQGRQQ